MRLATLLPTSATLMCATLISICGAISDYSIAVRGGCPSVLAFFNLAPISPCYGHKCTRSQCQADCDRTSACAGYEFDGSDQSNDQPGYCFLLSKACPVGLNKNGEDYMTRWTYMKLRHSFKDDIPITYHTVNAHKQLFKAVSKTGAQATEAPPVVANVFRPRHTWRNSAKKSNSLKVFGTLDVNSKPAMAKVPVSHMQDRVLDLPEFVTIRGGCPSPNAFLSMPANFICQGQRCHKIDCASACLMSSVCIGFEFDSWDQSSLSSSGFCWLLQSTCSSKLTHEGEDFATRWTYLKRGDDVISGINGDDQKLLINIAPASSGSSQYRGPFSPKVKEASEGKFSTHFIESSSNSNSAEISLSSQPLVPRMQFVHGWNLQQSYMMSIGGCTSAPQGGSLVYLPMELPPSMDDSVKPANHTHKPSVQEVSRSVKQCLFHQCTRFDCENTCNMRPDCVGYEFAGASHGLTTVGYCHLLRRPCPADQRSEGAVFLTRLTYLKAE